MLDFTDVREGRRTLADLAVGLSRPDLAQASRSMTEAILTRIDGCRDEDVTFVPVDPEAKDEFAADASEVGLPWTLGHVIAHVTASAEEAAFIAAEMARGIPPHGRSRFEVPWREVSTLEACRHRLDESLRMILASLDTWPDAPHLDVLWEAPHGGGPRNAVARFLGGLSHADAHLEQVAEIVRQGQARRAEREGARAAR